MGSWKSRVKQSMGSAWLRRARRQWTTGGVDLVSTRAQLIQRYTPGRTFIDVGGMWGIHGGNAFAAEEGGATRVILFDAMDPTDEFIARHRAASSRIKFIQGDLHEPESVELAGVSDVVWSTGVLYHSPHPFQLLQHLRQMVGQYLILGSRVIPEVPGLEQAAIFYPGTGEEQHAVFAGAHGAEARSLWGAAAPFDETPAMGYRNFWWGITPSALRGMLYHAGFDVLEEHRSFPFNVDLVASPSDRPSLFPALGFNRIRGLERTASFPASDRPAWA